MATALAEAGLARPDPEFQKLAEQLCRTLLRGPIARGILWTDEHGKEQFDFRIYIILGRSLLLYELMHASTRGADGEFISINVYDDRSVADSLDQVIQSWLDVGSYNWAVPWPMVMTEKCEHYPLNSDQRVIFEILLNGFWDALDRKGFCHRSDETGPLYLKVRNELDQWFPEGSRL